MVHTVLPQDVKNTMD